MKYYEKFILIKSVAKLDRFSFSEEAEKELDEGAAIDIHGQGGRVDVTEVTTEDLGSESNATLDDDDVRVVITEAVTADQGGQVDVIQAAIETLGGESDVISNLPSIIPSYDSDLRSIILSYDPGILATVPSHGSDILSIVSSYDSAAMIWTVIDKNKGDKVAINVANVTGDEVSEEEKDLQHGLNELRK